MNGQNITIIGSGLAGLVQALSLSARGVAVTLVGPLPALVQDDRTTAILNPGIALLQDLDLYDAVRATATPLVTMELVDGKTHHVYDAAEIGEDRFGYNIGNKALTDALSEKLNASANVTWHKTLATAITPVAAGWHLALKDGQELNADLLIGADGRNGMTRQAANIPLREKDIDQQALVTVLQAEKPHFNITLELFRKGGPLTLVPAGRDNFALVWCDETELLEQAVASGGDAIGAELTALTDSRFGALRVTGNLQLWPVRPMHAETLVGRNCVLIGDAAHTLPPIGAQGFNTTLQDVMALTDILVRNKAIGLPCNDASQLRAYETRRLPDIIMRYRSVNALNGLLRSDNPLAHGLRRLSLGGINRVGFLKKQLMFLGLRPRA